MAKGYVTSAFLKAKGTQLYTVFGWSQRREQRVPAKSWLLAIELFVSESDPTQAFQRFQAMRVRSISPQVMAAIAHCQQQLGGLTDPLVYLADHRLTVLGNGFKSFIDKENLVELASMSQEFPQVLLHLYANQDLEDDLAAIDSLEAFLELVAFLEHLGVLTPAIGSLDWGDFRKTVPMCHVTGFTRGNPVDRYYLQKFAQVIRDRVLGKVLEVGGVPRDREFYQFDKADSYQIMNLEPGAGIDLVGDVHNPTLIAPDSLDGIVIFNVLEHCYAPWIAVENLHRWLKPGGICFCMVPSAQRLHDRPGDFWRPLPDGLNWLFRNFSQRELFVYGNPLTVMASYHGVAYEELTTEELDAVHPDYPVSSCIVATK